MPEISSLVLAKQELHPLSKKRNILVSFLRFCRNLFLRVQPFSSGTHSNPREHSPALSLRFHDGELSFFNPPLKTVEDDVETLYNWKTKVMSDEWSPSQAEKALKKLTHVQVCDTLLNQEIFAGVNNVIKNEVLFRIKVHPESTIGSLPPKKLKELLKEAHNYSIDFYDRKKKFEIKKHLLIYKKKTCPECDLSVVKGYTGATNLLTCFCPNCQELYRHGTEIERTLTIDKLIF